MDELSKKMIDRFQRDFPLVERPYAELARKLGVSEDDVIEALKVLKENGTLSRVGAVFKPNTVGHSTLAAMAVEPDRLEEVAAVVSNFDAVNHNYEREHRLNLWFVVTTTDAQGVEQVIEDIEHMTGIKVLNLPMLEDYHLDLGFDLQWN
jgi:siroheme decarboxylase